jgi:hypothetical protein
MWGYPADVWCKKGGMPSLPEDFPEGPFATLDMHVDHIKRWALNPNTGDGIFYVRIKESVFTSSGDGVNKIRLVCNRAGRPLNAGASDSLSSRNRASIKCKCPWSMTLHLLRKPSDAHVSSDGHISASYVTNASMEHNHELPQKLVDSHTFNTNRALHPSLVQLAVDLAGFRSPSEINMQLVRIATKRGLEITWTPRDIQNWFPMVGLAGCWQSEDFLLRLTRDGRPHRQHLNDDGTVEGIVWLMHDGDVDVLEHAKHVVVFDNTFNTNSLGFKLGVFTTVDRFGKTRLVACSIMQHETRNGFAWVLQAFIELIQGRPAVCLTDGDLWLAEAIATVGGIVHLLCTWHLSNAILRNIKPLFQTGGDGRFSGCTAWSDFMHAWWLICWKSDTSSIATFDAEWDRLRHRIMDHCPDPGHPARVKALAYLGGGGTPGETSAEHPAQEEEGDDVDFHVASGSEQHRFFDIYSLRRKWAARFTSSVFTHGASSTQRGEGVFGEVKRRVLGGCSLQSLYETITEMVDQKAAVNISHVVRHSLQQHAFMLDTPLCISLRALGCAPFVLSLCAALVARSSMYHHEATPNPGEWYVWHHSASVTRGQNEDEVTAMEFQLGPEFDASGSIIKHITTLKTCSCQFPSRWGFLCCHMAKLYTTENVANFPSGVLSPAWLPVPDEAAARTRVAFLQVPLRSYTPQIPSLSLSPLHHFLTYCSILPIPL